MCFVFNFVVFYLWVNSDNITCWQSRHTTWFQIPYLGLCPPTSIDRKISLSLLSSAKCLASLIREPIFFQIYMASSEFGLKLIVLFFRKSMQILFTDRALLTIKRMDKILGKVSSSPYTLQSKNYCSLRGVTRFFRWQDSNLLWLDLNSWDDTSLQVDLVLSEAASTSEAQLV